MSSETRENVQPDGSFGEINYRPRNIEVSLRTSRTGSVPVPMLSVLDAVALIVGIVVGAGIFRTASLVASNAGNADAFLLAWIVGGLVSIAGALCYAELATTYPDSGGEFHFLSRAYGKKLAFLFAWARLTVIPTGSVALMAFVFGDYASQIFAFPGSTAAYATVVVLSLTILNSMGMRMGKTAQNLMTAAEVAGVVLIIITGFLMTSHSSGAVAEADSSGKTVWGLMMVFVLLTYGGWNDAAYISAEIRGRRRNIAKALFLSLGIVMLLYVLVNLAFLRGLGMKGISQSSAVASDLMQLAHGKTGAMVISVLIAISALTSANATIFMGARSNYALGRDYPIFSTLGRWNGSLQAPVNAILLQGAITLALVFFGAWTRKGFETMVEYTAPVFWFFILLTGLSVFILRRRDPDARRPFRVPLYPVTPLIFACTCAYLLYSSLAYTGIGALLGLAVLVSGTVLLKFKHFSVSTDRFH